MVIALYPRRIPKIIEAVPDKPVYSVAEVCALLGFSRGRLSGFSRMSLESSSCYAPSGCTSEAAERSPFPALSICA